VGRSWGVDASSGGSRQARSRARPIRYVGVDEKSFRKAHHYHTVVCDLERSTGRVCAPDRKVESLAPYFAGLTRAQPRHLRRPVAMDMWDPYIRATRDRPAGRAERMVFDRFT